MKYLVYTTRHTRARRATARPPGVGHTQYIQLGEAHRHARTGFLRLLNAVENNQLPPAAQRWQAPVEGLAWQLWQGGPLARPLAVALADSVPVIQCHPRLVSLLGGADTLDELHRWWADTYYSMTFRPASRATTVRTLRLGTAAGPDQESEHQR